MDEMLDAMELLDLVNVAWHKTGWWFQIHPQKLTWNLEMMVSNRNLIFQGSIFRFHVCFGGCIFYFHPYLGKVPILTSIFFKWVGSTTN